MISSLAALGVARDEKRKKEEVTEKIAEVTEKIAEEKRAGLKVNLPAGAAQEIDPTKASVVLIIPVNGEVVIAGRPMPDADIDNVFRAAFAKDKLTQVVLQADKGVPHGRVVNLMERAKRVGLTRLAIGTAGGG